MVENIFSFLVHTCHEDFHIYVKSVAFANNHKMCYDVYVQNELLLSDFIIGKWNVLY